MAYNGQPLKGVNGTVTFDGTFVTITRKGFMARTTVGKGEKRIPIGSITAVQWKQPGMVRGYIQFTLAGGIESKSRFGKQTTDAAKDENSVVIGSSHATAFAELRAAIESAIAARHQVPTAAPVATPASAADEIAKLVALRDSGALTEEEFAAHKAKLLNG